MHASLLTCVPASLLTCLPACQISSVYLTPFFCRRAIESVFVFQVRCWIQIIDGDTDLRLWISYWRDFLRNYRMDLWTIAGLSFSLCLDKAMLWNYSVGFFISCISSWNSTYLPIRVLHLCIVSVNIPQILLIYANVLQNWKACFWVLSVDICSKLYTFEDYGWMCGSAL